MRFIADLHIHSHYSRATSREMNIVSLTKWSQLKGTNLLGTGDFTHPQWFAELEEKLEPAEPGLFKLKEEHEKEIQPLVPERCRSPMRFMLTVEVSTIYKKNDKVRKVHSLIFAPSFEDAAKFNAKLVERGMNLAADGRPILGMQTKDVLALMLEISENMLFVPAHIWTPHFSVFGSMSGYDTLQECFEDLTPYVYAVETGLSSNPPMNWRIKELDRRTIISNSDAHSPAKLGREANVFETEQSYPAIRHALMHNTEGLAATIEFYPEEGKYHFDGHRECGVRLAPQESIGNSFQCPKCGRSVTVGVMHRVENLAEGNRPEPYEPEGARPFKSIVPLPEILAELAGVGVGTKKVQNRYFELLDKLGNEFHILLDAPLTSITQAGGEDLAAAIDKMRRGDLNILAGYDGEYGTVSIFTVKERERLQASAAKAQDALF